MHAVDGTAVGYKLISFPIMIWFVLFWKVLLIWQNAFTIFYEAPLTEQNEVT